MSWCCIGVIISLLVGVIVGVLYAFGLFTPLGAALWIVLGFAVLALLFVEAAVIFGAISCKNPISDCLCRGLCCLLTGIIGTILLVIILNSIAIAVTTAVIILVGILAFFFTLTLISLIALIRCIVRDMCLS